jgi:Gram-negative bacterial TonB protein C-terminal
MRLLLISFSLLISFNCFPQEIVNAVMADANGITNNQKKAKYLIVVKKDRTKSFERLDYNFRGPLIMMRTYNDSNLTTLDGEYMEYLSTGYLSSDGQYSQNKKNGDWFVYDDTSHAMLKYVYHLDTLLSIINLDSLAKEKSKIKEDTTGQIEAVYNGGTSKIFRIISTNFKVPDRTAALTKGGKGFIRFVIDTAGKPINLQVLKSVEFAFDEESLRVVALLKDWIPASDKGRKVRAYRIQPITVELE